MAAKPAANQRPRLYKKMHRRFGYRFNERTPRITSPYAFVGLIASLIMTLLLWLAMWLLNGNFTVAFFTQQLGWQTGYSWLAHLVISLIEQHLWKAKHMLRNLGLELYWSTIRWGVYPLILTVGVFDVGTSTWGVQKYMARHSVAVPNRQNLIDSFVSGLPLRSAWTIIAEGIAIAPEPLIVATVIILWKLFRAAYLQGKGTAHVGSIA